MVKKSWSSLKDFWPILLKMLICVNKQTTTNTDRQSNHSTLLCAWRAQAKYFGTGMANEISPSIPE